MTAFVLFIVFSLCAWGARSFQLGVAVGGVAVDGVRHRPAYRSLSSSNAARGWRRPVGSSRSWSARVLRASSSDNDSSSNKDESASESEMEELILSLSMEPTDESRRERLASIFEMELARTEEGAAERFAEEFDRILQKVGTEVQIAAREKALWSKTGGGVDEEPPASEQGEGESDADVSASTSSSEGGEGEDKGEEDYMHSGGKSAEEQQLWALVDMMVQSKTLVKRARGSLGSEGAFS